LSQKPDIAVAQVKNASENPVQANISPVLSILPSQGFRQAYSPEYSPFSSQTTTVQVSGSNGTSTKILANMNKMGELAVQYQESNPEAYNAIIKLGEKGKELAQAIKACEQGCSQTAIDNLRHQFESIWSGEVHGSGVYEQLSKQDQNLLLSLTNESGQLVADASSQVGVKVAEAGGGVTASSQSTCTGSGEGGCSAVSDSTATMSVSGQVQINTASNSSSGYQYSSTGKSGQSYSFNATSSQVNRNSQQTITCGQHEACATQSNGMALL
jgi:hypothetical protein